MRLVQASKPQQQPPRQASGTKPPAGRVTVPKLPLADLSDDDGVGGSSKQLVTF